MWKDSSMKDSITLKTMHEIKIISNPIRMRVLRNYYSYGKPATVKQMATSMGEVPANIHYHVKKLVEINVLVLDHTENVNGITAKFYEPSAKSIKIEDENDTINDGYINEKEIIISNIFDESRNEFLNCMRQKSEEENSGTIISSKIKLSDEEYESVIDYITNLVNTKKESEEKSKKTYLFFSGVIESL